jgi:hypothetical protein
MTANDIPQDLNWVEARAECSLRNIFTALEHGVREDVDTRISLLGEGAKMKLSVVSSNRRFTVLREDDVLPLSISDEATFVLNPDEILVQNSRNMVLFRASITLTNGGQCKLRVGEEELEQWQFRRMALEKLFFQPIKV